MYCHTSVQGNFKMIMNAAKDFDCGHCPPEKQSGSIKKGETFFFVNVFRTYEKHGNAYIPNSIYKKKNLIEIEPKDFRDFVTSRKMCMRCFINFHRFMRRGAEPLENILEYTISKTHTKRHFYATKTYRCIACAIKIEPGTQYVRFGYYDCFCQDCVSKVQGIIGKEYSY